MSAPRVFSYVQYLQGIGHLYRAAHIAAAMVEAGLGVDLVSGGMPVPKVSPENVTLHQLPPIRCRDGDFSDLVNALGAPLDDAYRDHRRDELLGLFRRQQPQILIVEAFPFGRRQMRFELLPLLEAAVNASPRPVVVCSVRDILQVREKPGRAQETLDLVDAYFDHVVVHGDPDFAPLEATFPRTREIRDKIHYTGLVGVFAEDAPVSCGDDRGEILVSAGGGATRSEVLLSLAMKARALSSAKDRPWRLLYGTNLPEEALTGLMADLPEGVTLEPNRSRAEFLDLLAACSLSVSQAGYNTVTDILHCGCRAVLAPYSARGETEQLHRARRMEELKLAHIVEAEQLSAESLAQAVDAALAAPPPARFPIDVRGAERSAELILSWLENQN